MIVTRAVERQRENRDIVNGLGFDERIRNTVRDPVEVRVQFLRELDETFLGVEANLETHDGQAFAFARSRVDVFDPGNFSEQLFQITYET